MKHSISGFLVLSTLMATALANAGWSQEPGVSPANAVLVDFDHGSGGVEFRATGHPSALKIVGKGSAPKGEFSLNGTQVRGTALFDLTSLDTGIGVRTRHMKEKYLETEKYHDAKLTITQMELPKSVTPGQVSAEQVPFTGTLALHGVEKPVSGTATLKQNGDKLSVDAQFGLKLSDYQINIPVFAGITVADEVQVSVSEAAPIKEAAKTTSQ